jgi:hypothetical protein
MPQPEPPPKDVNYLNLSERHQEHIKDQAKKRQLSPSEILSECIEYHLQNANT